MTRLLRRVALGVALLAGAPLATPVAAQSPGTPVAFDDGGRIFEITPGLADRLGLRPPTWPVEGEYKRARLYRTDAGSWVLEVQRFDDRLDRATLDDDRVGAIRLEVTARAGALQRATGRPVTPPLATATPTAAPADATPRAVTAARAPETPIASRAFVWRETLLGAALFGPLAWVAADSRAFSPSAYLFTATGTFLLATNAVNRAPFTRAQTTIGTLGALGGAAGGAALTFAFGGDDRRTQAIAAFVGGVGAHVGALAWGRGATASDAAGVTYGALAGAVLGAGALGAAGRLDGATTTERRTLAGVLTATTLVGAPLGRAYTARRDVRITDGDVGAVALAGAVGAVLGAGIAGGTTVADGPKYLWPTLVGAAGLLAGDRWLATPYDHDAVDVGTLAVGAGAGAAIATLPYWLAGNANERTLLLLAAAGGAAGLWGGEVVTRPRRGARIGAAPAVPREAPPRVTFDPAAIVGVALRAPGRHPVLSIRF